MSLITRCPDCGTMFKVVPDQLRISDGWVRCGHCAQIFDASLHLQAEAPVASGPVPYPFSEMPPDSGPESEGFDSSLNTEVGEGVPSEAPDSALLEAHARSLREDPLDRPFVLRIDSHPLPGAAERSGESGYGNVPAAAGEDPELDDLSFVRQARRQAFWRHPAVGALLFLGALVLAALLALQFMVQERDRLAATDPSLRPVLAALCRPLGCRLEPLRQIDAIAIDSSSFNKLRPEAYRLQVNIKNQSAVAVAMPALELTLTDGQDQPVVRRVLTPAELGAGEALGAASDWSGSVAVAVTPDPRGPRIAGYRLLAFYP